MKRFSKAILSWFRRRSEESRSAACLSDELESLLDLACYAASQAVTCLKLMERELDPFHFANEDHQHLLQKQAATKADLEQLRMIVDTLQNLLNSVRRNSGLEECMNENETARRMMSELCTPEDVWDLEQAVECRGKKSIGSEP